jgi:hypothetical protein
VRTHDEDGVVLDDDIQTTDTEADPSIGDQMSKALQAAYSKAERDWQRTQPYEIKSFEC